MVNLQEDLKIFDNDVYDILHIFESDVDLNKINLDVSVEYDKDLKECFVKVFLNRDQELSKSIKLVNNKLIDKRNLKRVIKLLIYNVISQNYNCQKPWGSLTGVRPSKIVYDLLAEGYSLDDVSTIMEQDYEVGKDKANLICNVVRNQLSNKMALNEVDLYINIPICPTRCSYCSFISSEYERCKKFVPEYINCLIKEINAVKNLINKKHLTIKNIYMGGGTPTTLSANDLSLILKQIDFPYNEFTVECGRPDTITLGKLEVLKNNNVTRISINPQTLNDTTLKVIGRKHTSGDFYKTYEMANNFNFIINTDLIAGLPNENFEDFKRTMDKIIEIAPDNITIHTLAVKRASMLNQNKEKVKSCNIAKMVEYAYNQLIQLGYKPYYLYRQKNMLGLYENVGYFKGNKICQFNIESMEEKANIIACGAGAISKRIFLNESRIERCANVKQIQDYILRIDEMIERKYDLFK